MPATDTDIAIVSFAQHALAEDRHNEQEMLLPVLDEVVGNVGLTKQDIGFTVSGSSDYLQGQPFAFVAALDAVGPWPPIAESHVEMDGAWALYEAWLRLQHGDIDTALVYAFGRSSPGDLFRTLALQLEPYTTATLFPDQVALAGLQARAMLEANGTTDRDVAEIVARSLTDATRNPHAVRSREMTADDVLAEPVWADPLRELDVAPITDGCAAVVLAAGDTARELSDNPVWIRGIDHRIEPHQLGLRDLADSPSTRTAAREAGAGDGPIDLAELHVQFAHQEPILGRRARPGGGHPDQPVGRAARQQPVHGHRPHPHRGGRRPPAGR